MLTQETLDSLGYRNLAEAARLVFGLDLAQDGLLVQRGDDDFDFFVELGGTKIVMEISDTSTSNPRAKGPGGWLSLGVYADPDKGLMRAPNGDRYIDLDVLVGEDERDYLKHEGSRGRDVEFLVGSLRILERHLGEDLRRAARSWPDLSESVEG